ncbi:Non-specific serine/threonine protein kinase [Heracleum sosnowskyi]|uniref:Non-specific serine/threonine protein kinase n=1 Tax=Heracleum sosnowskyi TaxID=360622 RepID=A0AAD8GPK3_9APIA|nr:Non-specific serine/threonine protein kinase [Heracleum sosnowskyi]
MGFQIFVYLNWPILLFAISGVLAEKAEAAGDECKMKRCSHHGPEIRFPFQLKDRQPEHCGLPGFRVSCHRGKTLLELQYPANTSLPGIQLFLSIEVMILLIDYTTQEIYLSGSEKMKANLTFVSTPSSSQWAISPPPFEMSPPHINAYTFASCSSRAEGQSQLTSLSGQAFPIYYFTTGMMQPRDKYITSCTKVFTSYLPTILQENRWSVASWSTPNCRKCEANGEYCKLIRNIQTADYNTTCLSKSVHQGSIKPIAGQGGYGSVYKGQITSDIIVAVKVLHSDPKASGEDFINEVGTIGRIYHVNVVRLVGYCADGCNRALVYEFQPNNSLEKFRYSGQNQSNNFLGWEKMQGIALGIAKGIEYLHQGCAQQILHFDIKPNNILLDCNFNPKISDFGLAKLCPRDQSIVSMTVARGTIGYIAPEVFSRNFGKVSSKSDVYSFGMLLLEMVGARNNTVENSTETYFPEWIYHHLEEGGEVAIQIDEEEDLNIARKLTIVGLWCIGWHPVDRPSMKHVINMLESQECPEMPPNPFGSNARSFTNDLEVISESE